MKTLPANIYTSTQVKELDRFAMDGFQLSGNILMERAGEAAFKLLRQHWPDKRKLAVFCGTGNNGGDGFVIARLAIEQDLAVRVFQMGEASKLQGDALAAQQRMLGAGLTPETYQAQPLDEFDIFVDAMLGTGIHGAVNAITAHAVEAMNAQPAPILAVDVPTGLNADTGAFQGKVIEADVTITYIGMKQGLLTGEGPEHCGELYFDDLNIPAGVYDMRSPSGHCLNYTQLIQSLPRRSRHAHKGDYGHALIVGGGPGMPGAIRLAGEAAMRTGAGRVTLVTHPGHAAVVNSSRPELICYGVEQADEIKPLLDLASVVAIGPGLGQSDWARQLVALVLDSGLPVVVDADALNILAESNQHNDNWVLTPHPGEAGRLLGKSTAEIQADRFSSIDELTRQFGGVAVLKGAGSLVKARKSLVSICPHGNPGMASGGMGDVLTGVIAGLIAQGLARQEAAELGVCIHSLAGDEAARTVGERGMLASDLMPWIRRLVNP